MSGGDQILKPEEQELEYKKAELTSLEADLIQRELDLATIRAELTSFEGQYLRTVGALYAELDEIEAQIAEILARRQPADQHAQDQAAQARAQAEESAQSASVTAEPKFKPTENLKKIFRDVAKRIHPDLAATDADRARRQTLMAQANLAYEQGDEAKLLNIFREWETSPDSVDGQGVGSELIRAIRKIAQIQRRIVDIEAEMQQLSTSDLYQLWVKQKEAENQGRDLIKDIVSRVEHDIDAARKRLAAIADRMQTHE